jgi:arylformamidase
MPIKTYIDLSHTIENGVTSYKGLPAPIICDYFSREESKVLYEEGTTFQIGKIEMVSNTGTYLDTPFHRYAHGHDLSQILIEQTADIEAIVINVPFSKQKSIGKSFFEGFDLENKALLIHTGWAIHWKTDTYYTGGPFITKEAAEYLVSQKVKLVGIDSHNIDDTTGNSRLVHTVLLGNEILIVEHLCNLEKIPKDVEITFSATPPKVKGMGTFPVRAFVSY